MLINGKRVDISDMDAVIAGLQSLPSGFAERNVNFTQVDYVSKAAKEQNRLGAESYKEWQQNKDPAKLEQAADYFYKATEIAEAAGDIPAMAQNIANYGWMQIYANQPENALPAFKKTIDIHQKHNHIDLLYKDLGALHKATLDTILVKEEKGLLEDAIELRQTLRPLRKRSLEIFDFTQGIEKENTAYRIEQREIGFSANEPIGTHNVNQCICVRYMIPQVRKQCLLILMKGQISLLYNLPSIACLRIQPYKPELWERVFFWFI